MIHAAALGKRFGPITVLDAVSLDVAAGQCLAVLGPNGAGKTTLLRILGTLARPTTGRLLLDGVDAVKAPERVRGRIALLGHGSQVYEDLTALENLEFWIGLHGGDPSRARLERALQQVELEAFAAERARTFSAGMKRRLALARLALGAPRLVFLDEPYTGLDQRGRKWLTELLLAHKGAGAALVIATHSFGDALDVADRVAILTGGRVALDRPRAELTREALARHYEELTASAGEPA